jgi:hypothetical protein
LKLTGAAFVRFFVDTRRSYSLNGVNWQRRCGFLYPLYSFCIESLLGFKYAGLALAALQKSYALYKG